MNKPNSSNLGIEPISKLLFKQALPASIGILVMSLNILIDTIFVGQWIGSIAIAAINVVLPVSFFIAALGMAIGIGGSSIISRSLGSDNIQKARYTFANQITLTILITVSFVFLGLYFIESIIPLFGGKGGIYEPSKIYYTIVLYGVPFLALSMMGNSVIRAEGKPKFAMYALMIPSIGNIVLDIVFIKYLNMGMAGAAWATTGSYILCFIFIFWFFSSDKSELKIKIHHLYLKKLIVKEITSLGSITLARQATVSITYLLMNNILYNYGGEVSVTAYAIVGRMMMFSLFPVYGITQGFLPIAGYNFGAKNFERVKEVISLAIKYASFFATLVFLILMIFPEEITKVFTSDTDVIRETPAAMRWVFLATPIIAIQLIGAAYFQGIGKAKIGLILALLRQGILFVPLILILPLFYGEMGAWMSFPISDLLATIITGVVLTREVKKRLV
ncbi:MATE family efflux transporter [Flavobacteriaceae bacterium]|jgi:putative MATE family efflux protein|nr:MATE family efflux transporter [Flavobacteriaceae bacterium]MBC8396854.1 MATE family efflux transporter [Flavobacteriales bacterium]RPG63516.1 MAG: MATE family efflux transporter [Flavobacteriaceae bacterium TMED238]MDA8626126.1 MATE family efflux transporter [Flavobacteriaceae bacterium]MDA9550391.1 MATE family efflux transporter [Flavobacteriaceae bacterium]